MLTAARPAPSPDTGINPFARSLDYEYGSKGSGELRDVEARSGAARDRRPGRKQVGEGAARMSTGRRVARNAALLMVMRVLLQLIGLGSTVVLARLLMPEDFGLVALAMSYLAIIEGVTALNLYSALIRIRDNAPELYNTSWTLSVLRGGAISLFVALSAAFVPQLMNEPRLGAVILVLALQPLIQGLGNPRFVQYEKELDLRPLFLLSVVSKLAATAFTVAVAVIFRNYWALVIGSLAAAVLNMIMGYVMRPYLPRPDFSRVREIFGFTAWLSGVSILSTLNLRMDSFIVGGFLGTATVGLYRMGEEIATLPTTQMVAPLTRSLYPAFANMAAEPGKLRNNALEASAAIAAISLPATFGFAFVARDVVTLMLGEKWLEIVPLIQILTPIIGLQMLAPVAGSVCMAMGRTRVVFWNEVIYCVFRLSAIFAGVLLAGFAGIVMARGMSGLLRLVLNAEMLRRTIGTGFRMIVSNAWRSLASVVAMAAMLALVQPALADTGLVLRIVSTVAIGALVYVLAHLSLWQASGRPSGAERRMLDLVGSIRSGMTQRKEAT